MPFPSSPRRVVADMHTQYSSDLHPHIGKVPGKPGQWICAGFHGHGMSFILLSAKGIVDMIKNGVPFERSGIPRLFETSEARLRSTRNDIISRSEPQVGNEKTPSLPDGAK